MIDPLGSAVQPRGGQFDKRLLEITEPNGKGIMRVVPAYSGGYASGSKNQGSSPAGDFGAEQFEFTPGFGLTKHRVP